MAKASDNVFPRVIYGLNSADQAAPSDSSWRLYAKANGIFARSSNSIVGPFATSAGGTGQGLVDYGFNKRTSGDVTLNSTSWANVDTGMDITLTASTGDTVEVAVSAFYGNEGVTASLDVVTLVSGSPVNSLATGTTPSDSNFGIAGLRIASTSAVVANAAASIMYTLQSGDISAGSVTLRLRYRTSTAANRTLNASPATPLHFSAKNFGAAL